MRGSLLLIALASALLAGCSDGSSGEDRRLNAAAAALEANGTDANAVEIIDEPEANTQ